MIAIDPGPTESAICLIHGPERFEARKVNNEKLLVWLQGQNSCYPMAIEVMQCMGMAVGQSVFTTCEWIGRFTYVHKAEQFRVTRNQVKLHMCGTTKAKDTNIRQALIDRFGEPGKLRSPGILYGITKDMWSALAIGLTALETMKQEK